MTTLYKLDSNNRLRIWTIELNGLGSYRTITGLVDGKKVTSEWTATIPTNVGRSNERDVVAQAEFEVNALILDKMNENYTTSITAATTHIKPFEPMLANKYKSWEYLNVKNYVFSQPKLDGIRCNIFKVNNDIVLQSRNKKEIVAVPHIAEALIPIFQSYPSIILDGELYNHNLRDDFNSITSLVRKTKNISQEDFELSKKMIQYHIYDMYDQEGEYNFEERRVVLTKIFRDNLNKCLQLVQTDHITNEIELMDKFAEYVSMGYEGQMIREPKSFYEQKRSKNLLKHKPTGIDAEYEIVGVVEGKGNWSGKAKVIECKMESGRTFSATIKGNMEYLENVLKNRDKYIGKKATVWCQNFTPDGIPRFPIAKEIDRWDI